jgi:hypothetical protein
MLVEVVLRDAGRVRVLRLNGTNATNATNGTNGTNECVMEVWVLADGHQAGGHQADGHQADGHQADGHHADPPSPNGYGAASGDNGKLQMADGKGNDGEFILQESVVSKRAWFASRSLRRHRQGLYP